MSELAQIGRRTDVQAALFELSDAVAELSPYQMGVQPMASNYDPALALKRLRVEGLADMIVPEGFPLVDPNDELSLTMPANDENLVHVNLFTVQERPKADTMESRWKRRVGLTFAYKEGRKRRLAAQELTLSSTSDAEDQQPYTIMRSLHSVTRSGYEHSVKHSQIERVSPSREEALGMLRVAVAVFEGQRCATC